MNKRYRLGEIEEVVSDMEELIGLEDDIAEIDDEFQIVVSGWSVYVESLNLTLRQGIACAWDEDEGLQFTLDDGTGTDRTILSGIHAYYEPEELVGKTLIAITNLPPRKMMGIESCGMLLSAVNNLKDSEDEELHLLMVDNHIPAGAKLY